MNITLSRIPRKDGEWKLWRARSDCRRYDAVIPAANQGEAVRIIIAQVAWQFSGTSARIWPK